MNQKCLTTIFVPVHPLNFNVNPPSVCQIHQKPLSYYNKCKPNNEPICIDCLLNEIKEGKETNLYLPISNLEQEYYYQKNAFCQILEQANNMKKYDTHITNLSLKQKVTKRNEITIFDNNEKIKKLNPIL